MTSTEDDKVIRVPYHHLQLFIENVQDRVWEKAAGMSRLPAGGEKAGGAVSPVLSKGG